MHKRRMHVARSKKPGRDEEDREHDGVRAAAHDEQSAESPLAATGILRLQKTIGNQAVQRLIVQRQPKGGGDKPKAQEPSSSVVASMTLDAQGKLNDVKLESLEFAGKTTSGIKGREEEAPKIEIVVTKEIDSSSVALRKAAISGEMIETAKFDFIRRAEDGTLETVHTLEFVKGYVTSLSTSSAGGDRQLDVVAMQFEGMA